MIRVFDAYGRELFITRAKWRDEVLLRNLENAKDDPDKLAGMLIGALRDGFGKDVVAYAEHLHRIDSTPSRAATLLGVVYLDAGRPKDAERVLMDHLARHGEDPFVLTNLAKAQDARGEHGASEATLWRALELDPNQDNGFGWFVAIHRERHGEAGYLEACRRVSALPASWRAQLWLARDALQRGDVPAALALYQESLSRAGTQAPADLLGQLSGDLGGAGRLSEIVSLVEPRFDPALHGLEVGNNLIKARLELGHLDQAQSVIERLYAQNRPDWRPHLEFWAAEVSKARVGHLAAVSDEALSMAMVSIEGPLWLRQASPCAALVTPKPANAPRVAFLGSTALKAGIGEVPRLQVADGPGRISRALPLVMAEQVHLTTRAAGVALIPWIEGQGFAVLGQAYSDADVCGVAKKAQDSPAMVGSLVVDATGTDWRASLRILRVADGACIGAGEVRVDPSDPAPGVERLTSRMIDILGDAGIGPTGAPSWYQRPGGASGSNYLLRLEQQLAVVSGNLESLHGGQLSGEHEIVEGTIGLCRQEPGNATARLLLAQTLLQMKKRRPDILRQYQARAELLQREHPLRGEVGTCIAAALREVYSP